MTSAVANELTSAWKERLGLTHRRSPEFYENSEAVVDVPHALAIRAALDDMGVSAIFCVQSVPTIAIYVCDRFDPNKVMSLYGALWNQGLASLLLVIVEGTLRAYSLARKPLHESADAFERRCLIQALGEATQALEFRNLIHGAESGRLWRDHADQFRPKERIDQVLLDNLVASHALLQKARLNSDAAQALLIQAMFVAYLEDREIVTPAYFAGVSAGRCISFSELLRTGNVELLRALFRTLREDFNGDLFVAPCSFEPDAPAPTISTEHLTILDRFRSGREEMARGGQQRFWGYDFRYIPIELVSAVYDRFFGEREKERREKGAFYTPMFLADTVVSQAWALLPDKAKAFGRILDPACGSGMFLVRTFQRLCEHWRGTHQSRKIPWKTLLSLLGRTHGWDINPGAVRVAVFSLYVALLEEVSPRDIRELIQHGKILPELWGNSLVHQDFFAKASEASFDLVIGNPPWTSRRGGDRTSIKWSRQHRRPMPGGEDAWAFSWKAVEHLTNEGLVAFLLPSMGFLHNHASATVSARNAFFTACRVRRVVNFADLRFQLFEHAHRPAALILYGPQLPNAFPYRFEYWVPKADLNLRIKRVITLSTIDKLSLDVATVIDNPLVFKQRLWMREPDAKLFAYLSRLPKLGNLVREYGDLSRRKERLTGRWVIGQGYQPLGDEDEGQASRVKPVESHYVGTFPDLPIGAFTRLAQSPHGLRPAVSSSVRRRGFEAGFEGVRVLIPQGVETTQSRLRAAYCDATLTFQHILQAITVPDGQEGQAKLLTALLNSRVAIWYAFHGTGSFGSDRPKVHQEDLLRLPFPSPADLADSKAASEAARELIRIVDEIYQIENGPFALKDDQGELLRRIDRLAYIYFGLSDDETALIDDTVDFIVPALQPHEGFFPALWQAPDRNQRRLYSRTLTDSLRGWFPSGGGIGAYLAACGADLAVLRLQLDLPDDYREEEDSDLASVLTDLSQHVNQPLDGNFQLMPDLRIFAGESLYLVKPMQLRFWLRSTALADADDIALELQQLRTAAERRRSLG
ncbi:MAG: N-6 DNA methylase [Inquilinus limosus]|uniref:site-specific DNA-methyltransferase (adenine-specific) n=1 Tax=Inquilinus limosus TaxID=171674 RepID=A0A952FHG6_9PROT|nr:N-6 DNA methylase [Inquilinus limosus]